MKTVLSRIVLTVLCGFLYISCDQEPLFYDIAGEYPPIEPIIEGSPSRIVATNNALYVSNGDVWEYEIGNPGWGPITLGERIKTVAAEETLGYLFTLDWDGVLHRRNGTTWDSIDYLGEAPEQIFCAGGYLFAGARNGDDYHILSMNMADTPPLFMIEIGDDTGFLAGAAKVGGIYFLGTRKGIYQTTAPATAGSLLLDPDPPTDPIVGLIGDGPNVVAVTTEQTVLYYDGSNFSSRGTGPHFSGALAIWSIASAPTDRLLLLGLQRGSGYYGYGYREMKWPTAGLSSGLYDPGSTSPQTSVEPKSQYISAIGKHGVTSLYVLTTKSSGDNAGRPIIFASTAKNGLWSYRVRDNRAQWNGEDNSGY